LRGGGGMSKEMQASAAVFIIGLRGWSRNNGHQLSGLQVSGLRMSKIGRCM
jgi:hypothetical protein